MLRTITVGSSLLIQGTAVGRMTDGRLMIRVGDRVFVGYPVRRLTRAKA